MNMEKYNFDNYLKNELIFWKSLRAYYTGEKTKNRVLMGIKKRYSEEFIIGMAKKRYNNMTKIIRLFKDEYIEELIHRVKKKTNIDLGKDLDFENIFHRESKKPEGVPEKLYFWIEVAVILVAITVVILAEHYDNNGEGEDDAVIVTVETSGLQAVVDENKFFTCDEIEDLSYSTWVTYLLMLQAIDSAQYISALICAKCENLEVLAEAMSYDHALILPDDITCLGSFLYSAKLEECEIPY